MNSSLSGLSLISLAAIPVFGLQESQSKVANLPKGFSRQYKSLFKAYEKADKLQTGEEEKTSSSSN